MTTAILLAGGRGTRCGGDVPKQFQPLAGKPVVAYALALLRAVADRRIVACDAAYDDTIRALDGQVRCVAAGHSRFASLQHAVAALIADDGDDDGNDDEWVLIHDAARPCAALADVRALLASAATADGSDGGYLAAPVVDTLRRHNGTRPTTLARALVHAVQTPQCVRRRVLRTALTMPDDASITDDAELVLRGGGDVFFVTAQHPNPKITVATDFAVCEALLRVSA